MFEYTGNIHIHSRYSDGGGSIGEIAASAAETGLDFVVVTDHATLRGLAEGEEGYRGGVLVLIGMEVNKDFNHYLALGVKEPIPDNDDDPQQVIDEVNRQKGVGIIAHPFEKGSPRYQDGRSFPWRGWDVDGFQGIEIWNYLSQCRDAFTSLGKGLCLLLAPAATLPPPSFQALEQLDRLQREGKRVFAFGGSDAHDIKIGAGGFRIAVSPYKLCFKLINTHILCDEKLSGEPAADKDMIYQALVAGRSWVACDYYCRSDGFRFELRHGSRNWPAGSRTRYRPGVWIDVETPDAATVTLVADGRRARVSMGRRHCFTDIGPGVYRVEAYLKRGRRFYPWIFSNPIWVTR